MFLRRGRRNPDYGDGAWFRWALSVHQLGDLFALAFDLLHAGKREEAFDQFGRIQAASSMFSQSNINVLIARGVFRPGTKIRTAPGATFSSAPATSSDEIKRVLDTYLKPYLRA